MYVVTFYSFKGGVGQSMALMNCAAELVNNGRKVLLVDFDLEAPGLDSFFSKKMKSHTEGIVEYVGCYLDSGVVPPLEQYVRKCPLKTDSDGELWLLPSGNRDYRYHKNLYKIDWRDLYERKDGYLLVENLKGQWKENLAPDYVFIDSRSGFTDVGQICTRQLPDAVLFLFFPNIQNLNGLHSIVNWVREEEKLQNRKITEHFAMSNVPDLDDEEGTLRHLVSEFKEKLQIEDSQITTIHHYPSLSLLKQEIFTLKRPQSRLASEYKSLLSKIQK